jgi:hypothetical protein
MAASLNALLSPSTGSSFQTKNNPAFRAWWQERAIVSKSPLKWEQVLTDRLNELCALPVGWDGYGGLPVKYEVASFASQIVTTICSRFETPPQVVPGTNGDLQLEWHLPQRSVELHVLAPNRVRASREEQDEGTEINLTNDFTAVVRWLRGEAEVAHIAAANQ